MFMTSVLRTFAGAIALTWPHTSRSRADADVADLFAGQHKSENDDLRYFLSRCPRKSRLGRELIKCEASAAWTDAVPCRVGKAPDSGRDCCNAKWSAWRQKLTHAPLQKLASALSDDNEGPSAMVDQRQHRTPHLVNVQLVVVATSSQA